MSGQNELEAQQMKRELPFELLRLQFFLAAHFFVKLVLKEKWVGKMDSEQVIGYLRD